jgi:phosphoribosyl 1,2-cyclic phosphodiesterase
MAPYHNVNVLQPKKVYEIGSFKVQPFELKHDVQNFGYLLNHPESGLFPFITDTHYCPFKFPGMNNILVEANYDDKIIERKLLAGTGNMYVRNRVIMSHLEIDTTIDFLKANDLSKVNNIVLLHLSEGNSNAADFQKRVQEATGKSVFVAVPGLEIDFNKTSF